MQVHFILRNYMISSNVFPKLANLLAGLALLVGSVQADPLLTYPLKIRNHELRAEVANSEDSTAPGPDVPRPAGRERRDDLSLP